MPTSASRPTSPIALSVTSPSETPSEDATLALPLLPWPLAAALAGVVAAVVGLLLTAGVAAVAWFSATTMALPDVISFATRLWLLAHGGSLVIAGTPLTLAPLGLSVLGLFLANGAGRVAGGQAALARPGVRSPALTRGLAAAVAGLVGAGYGAASLVAAMAVGERATSWLPAVGGFAVGLAGALPGACRGLGTHLTALLPRPVAGALRGGGVIVLALLALGAVVLGIAVVTGVERIAKLEGSLALDPSGVLVASALTLAYLPDALVWAISWALGAGFTVGADSLVTLSGTHLGLLPAVPVLGALPEPGVAPSWLVGWMAGGVLAGVLGGVVAVRALEARPRWPHATLASVLAGLGGCVVLLGAALASSGGLGGLRLAGMGPRVTELAWVGVPLIALAAVVAGQLTWAVVRRAARRR